MENTDMPDNKLVDKKFDNPPKDMFTNMFGSGGSSEMYKQSYEGMRAMSREELMLLRARDAQQCVFSEEADTQAAWYAQQAQSVRPFNPWRQLHSAPAFEQPEAVKPEAPAALWQRIRNWFLKLLQNWRV